MPFQKPPSICSVCKRGSRFSFFRDYESRYGKFSLYECGSCGVQFWMPFVNPGNQWYENDSQYQRNLITSEPKITKEAQRKFLQSHKDLKGKKILDVGCGTGEFIAAAQEKGAEVWGVDFDRTAISVAKEQFNLSNVYAMSLDEFFSSIQSPQFDYITCFEVIEHVDDPLGLIESFEKLLKPQGTIVISTPSRERAFPNMYQLDFPPHHLTRWNKESLLNVLSPFQFEIASVYYLDKLLNIFQAMNSRFHLELVEKTTAISASTGKKTSFIVSRVVRAIGIIKDLALAGIPATGLWTFGLLTRRKNGDMMVEFQKNKNL